MRWRRPVQDCSKVTHYEGVLGTAFEFQASGADSSVVENAERAALTEIDRLEGVFSRYLPDSDLARWERGEPASSKLLPILQLADSWRRRTDNAFHPATEALTVLWLGGQPDPETLRRTVEALHGPLWTPEGVRLTGFPANLNAIAKGHIIDRAAQAALIEGIDTVLVNIGGDMRHRGRKPVTVEVVNPFAPADNAEPLAQIRLQDAGMATSGGYHRGRHLFDPRTGLPVEHIVSATVIAEDALTADVLATAFSVLHPCESLELADSIPDIACLLVNAEGRTFVNPAWSRYAA